MSRHLAGRRHSSSFIAGENGWEHRGGIPWADAPVPRIWHLCRAQTQGWVNLRDWSQICACGGTRIGDGPWQDRNSRRADPRPP
jgi:hypothetical protein